MNSLTNENIQKFKYRVARPKVCMRPYFIPTISIVKFLCNVADINDESKLGLLLSAAQCGRVDCVKYLVSQHVHLFVDSDHALYLASRGGHLEVVRCLVLCGTHSRAQIDHAIRLASDRDHIKVVEYLASERGRSNKTKNE
jgi:hypothetical protein